MTKERYGCGETLQEQIEIARKKTVTKHMRLGNDIEAMLRTEQRSDRMIERYLDLSEKQLNNV